MMYFSGHTLAICLFAALTSVSVASFQEACHDGATCDDIPMTDVARASALLQTKSASVTQATQAQVHEACVEVPAILLEMHAQTVQRQASAPSLYVKQEPTFSGTEAASMRACGSTETASQQEHLGEPSGTVCTLFGQQGTCAVSPSAQHGQRGCDIGQWAACENQGVTYPNGPQGPTAPKTGGDCSASGLQGTCQVGGTKRQGFGGFQSFLTCEIDHRPNEDLLYVACDRVKAIYPMPPGTDMSCRVDMGDGEAAKEGTCVGLTRGAWWCELGQSAACQGQGIDKRCDLLGQEGKCSRNSFGYMYCNIWPIAPTNPVIDPRTPTGATGATGTTSSLDAAGFRATTSLCCPSEMEQFFNRLLTFLGYSVCSKPHVQGLMHWFQCVPDMDFQYMLDVIANGNPCKYWSPLGTNCPVLSSECAGHWCGH